MAAKETLARLTAAGFTLRVNAAGDKVRISPSPVPPELVELVRADKAELLALLSRVETTRSGVSTANARTPATTGCGSVSPAPEAPTSGYSTNGGTSLAGFPLDPDSGAPFSPWIAPMTADEFDCRRTELVGMIEDLAEIEGWPRDYLDDVLSRAIRGPVGDLRPNWHYFTKRLKEVRHGR
ncbi:hypothetical protein OVY01_13515 [Robbsia sp. Bb-Pol-6]|uniref:TubC N-terminal docking domain-containing protein n=1 Tax=Robbsia betulipollinis TaxID=2981849 RepID=A0ABT3ZPA8_9BURK|nr:hypothetical protein [Robbsia betulipollinis]MCY0388237.1 hypothetical protein [Robbsia betulipollinis]